jgi:hypothetical protein
VDRITKKGLAVVGGPCLAALVLCLTSGMANAHVKWFAPFDVSGLPRPLAETLSINFWLLNLGAVVLLLLGSLAERTQLGFVLVQSIDQVGVSVRNNTDKLLRAAVGTFFVALWALGHIIMTPELKTDAEAISWLQAAIALGMLWRRTMILSALGICFLYAYAVSIYGPFHMADYPVFLGVAAYLALQGLRMGFFGMRPIDVARWGAAVTLMWASVEKWAYPQWTFPLLAQHPALARGIEPDFYMTMAGAIEFVLAFSLIWTPLVRRVGAIILSAMFISAIWEFGKIDAIGHLLIIVLLLIIVADDEPRFRRQPVLAPVLYCLAVFVAISAYYGLHSLVFGNKVF